MLKRFALPGLVVLVLIASAWYFASRTPQTGPSTSVIFAQDSDTSGFARAFEPILFEFPRDHGPHFDFQTEWWYYTGNLEDADGNHYGYQLTFFRRGLTPGGTGAGASPASTGDGVSGTGSGAGISPAPATGLATNQIYFAHFAITDVEGNTHTFAERFSRGAGGLAGGSGEPFRVWLEDWSTTALDGEGNVVRLQARDGDMMIDLTLRATKPIVAHGDQGLSPKSEERGNASYYLSFTRMETQGQIAANGQTSTVSGESWFDHEWSTSALGPHGIGWDWFSLQLSDGRELMFFQVRRDDGGLESVSGGTLIESDGSTRRLSVDEVQIRVADTWRSSETGAEYPAGWEISIPSAGIELTVEPWVAAQEMRTTFVYWEGAVKISGTSDGIPVSGNGYIELTGYKGTMQGVF